MGVCIFCERPAGFMSVVHKRCRMRRSTAAERIGELFEPFLSASMPVQEFARLIEDSASSNLLQRHELTALVADWVREALELIESSRVTSADERARAAEIVNHFSSHASGELPRWVELWGHLDICSPVMSRDPLMALPAQAEPAAHLSAS